MNGCKRNHAILGSTIFGFFFPLGKTNASLYVVHGETKIVAPPIRWHRDGKIWFGQNLVQENFSGKNPGVIAVGDRVRVLD